MRELAALLVVASGLAGAQRFAASEILDALVEEAIARDEIPGAVLLVGQPGRLLHLKAYGFRALEPRREAMTVDTIFDAASLTKVVATTPAIMKLFEWGKLRLNDPVTRYLPDFQGGASAITVRDLLTHFSGLRPGLDLRPPWSGKQTGYFLAFVDPPAEAPGVRFVYSDINFILLGALVENVSGRPLDEFVTEQVWRPLGMTETMFRPPSGLRPRIAPTEIVEGTLLRGVVHDPTARFMGGVAGHAGMFTTAADLARFAEMMLGEGEREGVRIFSALTVRKFTTPQSPPDQPILRGLGWDIESPYSGNRGELFPVGSYGHTGFTGTSLWIDPLSRTYVILLANSIHPYLRPPITSLRGRVATAVAAALDIRTPGIAITGYNETLVSGGRRRAVARNGDVLTGLDVLVREKFARLAGKRVGLITNHTGVDRNGRRNVDLMREAGIRVTALFSPEHGISGREDHDRIAHGRDATTGIPVFSLYHGDLRRPTEQMLREVDVLVFDIQDVGARFYTYVTTMAYAMEEAARRKIPFVVLDRPNPITGTRVEGPMLEPGLESFVGYMPMPLRHGMTVGELAQFFNRENRIGVELNVVRMEGWQRGDWFDSTGLTWVDPSPNMRSLNAALLYPGVAMLEYSSNYSVGRGTDAPFEQIGAEWIRGRELASYLNRRFIPGVRVYPTRFQPTSSRLAGRWIEGVRFLVTDREIFDSARLGLELAAALLKLYPDKLDLEANLRLIGSRAVVTALRAGEDPRLILERERESLERFLERRQASLFYR
ncbi:MAG: DUF1343 domain-containing protein [Bryobacterales bacterium]|nr:DUF1343 domain-containing protein [Bryobacterales bacterium]